MARRVFFSFHYAHDCFRANQVRNANVVAGPDVAGFFDHSEYEDAKKSGDAAIRRMIGRHLDGTTVTVVLVGTFTAYRPWVQFEIDESMKRDNGIIAVRIHHLRGPLPGLSPWMWGPSDPGPLPWLPARGSLDYGHWDWNLARFRRAIEGAAQWAERARALKTEARRLALKAMLGSRLSALPFMTTPTLSALVQAEALRGDREPSPPSWEDLIRPAPHPRTLGGPPGPPTSLDLLADMIRKGSFKR